MKKTRVHIVIYRKKRGKTTFWTFGHVLYVHQSQRGEAAHWLLLTRVLFSPNWARKQAKDKPNKQTNIIQNGGSQREGDWLLPGNRVTGSQSSRRAGIIWGHCPGEQSLPANLTPPTMLLHGEGREARPEDCHSMLRVAHVMYARHHLAVKIHLTVYNLSLEHWKLNWSGRNGTVFWIAFFIHEYRRRNYWQFSQHRSRKKMFTDVLEWNNLMKPVQTHWYSNLKVCFCFLYGSHCITFTYVFCLFT